MSGFELNKIIGSILGLILFIIITGNITEIIYKENFIPINYLKENTISDAKKEINTEATSVNENIADSLKERLFVADIENGKEYTKRCIACHSFNNDGKNKLGPNLYDIFNRKVGSIDNFSYSKALLNNDQIWSEFNLDEFLANPKKWAPGTKMVFMGIKNSQDRADVIKYIQTLN